MTWPQVGDELGLRGKTWRLMLRRKMDGMQFYYEEWLPVRTHRSVDDAIASAVCDLRAIRLQTIV